MAASVLTVPCVEDNSAQLIIPYNKEYNVDPEDDLTTRRALSHHEAPAFLIDLWTSCLSSWNNLSHTKPFYIRTLVYTLQLNIHSILLFTNHKNISPTTHSPATRQ